MRVGLPGRLQGSAGLLDGFLFDSLRYWLQHQVVSTERCPTAYEDLLHPKWKGQIGLETEEYQWFYHLIQILGKEKGIDFMRRLLGKTCKCAKAIRLSRTRGRG